MGVQPLPSRHDDVDRRPPRPVSGLTEWQEQSRRSGAPLAPVPSITAIATVGAIIEPITLALVEESEVDFDAMVNELCDLVNAMLFSPHR